MNGGLGLVEGGMSVSGKRRKNLKFKFIAHKKSSLARTELLVGRRNVGQRSKTFYLYLHSTPNDVTLRTPRPTELLDELHV